MASTSRKGRRKVPGGRWLPALSPGARRRLAGGVLLAAGAVAALSLLFPEGPITPWIRGLLLFTAGWGAMALPVGMLWVGGLLLRGSFNPRRRQILGACLLLPSFLGLLHLLPGGEAGGQGMGVALRHLLPWAEPDPRALAEAGRGGGWLGYLVGALLLRGNLSGAGSLLVVVAGLLAGAALLARVSPQQVARVAWGLGGMAWRRLREWRAERKREVVINGARQVAPPQPKVAARQTTPPASAPETPPASDAPAEPPREWTLPPMDLLEAAPEAELSTVDIRQRIRVIEETLRSFGVEARVVEVNQGPAVTQFGVEPGVGVKVARIMALGNDLALRLAAAPLRLEAPVPGKHVVGIEVPNDTVSVVSLRELLESPTFQKHRGRLRLGLGRDVSGAPVVGDLARMPHLLIAGATGSGKSVCLNSFIVALLCQCTPADLRFLMIDPKMVELLPFNGVPHLLTPVVTDMEKVVPSLNWVVGEMQRRYRIFAARGVRNVEAYNRATTGSGEDIPLPYLVVIIDELADLMMVAPDEVEKILCRLAQLARATGIHLVVATQRPSVDVVTGLIKANFPTRISFAVTSQIDSRVILDQGGAEKLLGRGDMLYLPPDSAKPVRLQGTYVSDGEIRDLVDYWKKSRPLGYTDTLPDGTVFQPVDEDENADDLLEEAVELAQQHNRVSASLLQRRLRVGYNRAVRLLELLERQGIVGPAEDGKAREVLVRSESPGDVEGPRSEGS